MRIGMGARGKAARNAEISGHHEIIDSDILKFHQVG
jgi:hypothetical protein